MSEVKQLSPSRKVIKSWKKAIENSGKKGEIVGLIFFYVRIAKIKFPFESDIDPRNFQIPSKLWKEIANHIVTNSNSMGAGFTWMNLGPGAYD